MWRKQCVEARAPESTPATAAWTSSTLLLAILCAVQSLCVLSLWRRLAKAKGKSSAESSEPHEDAITRVSPDVTPWPLQDIEAYLIDLDGTIYSPQGPIEGAAEFYASVLRHKPHVFLSNTGAKGADGVREKLNATMTFCFWPEAKVQSAEYELLRNNSCLINSDLGGRAIGYRTVL